MSVVILCSGPGCPLDGGYALLSWVQAWCLVSCLEKPRMKTQKFGCAPRSQSSDISTGEGHWPLQSTTVAKSLGHGVPEKGKRLPNGEREGSMFLGHNHVSYCWELPACCPGFFFFKPLTHNFPTNGTVVSLPAPGPLCPSAQQNRVP